MTLPQLRISLALWKGKLQYRRRKHKFYHTQSKLPKTERDHQAAKWHGMAEHAKEMILRRHRQIVSKERANRKKAAATTGVGRYDGVPVAAWIIPYLQWARENGWHGRLVSGWRDPAYSESLCYRICGRPSCSGTCAGRNSNHSGSAKPHGAVDVSDYIKFAQVIQHCPLSPKLFNALPRDRVHFSASGN